MNIMAKTCAGLLMLGAVIAANFTNPVYAQPPSDMGGWELDSPYNRLYRLTERDQFKGIVKGFGIVTPFEGMSPGVALTVLDRENELITVHLGPRWFIDPGQTGIKKGDNVKVKGVWAEIDGEDIFMASKIKKGEFFEFKIRLTRDGTPFWTMTKEEITRERSSN